jgi:hypothetical protein
MTAYQQTMKRELSAAEARRDASAADVKKLQALTAQLGAAAKGPNKSLQDEVARLEGRVKGRQDLLDRLKGSGIGNTEGYAKFLEALARQHEDGLWLTRITIGDGGGNFSLQGRVLRPELLSTYIQMLSREDALRGRSIGEMKVAEKVEKGSADAAKKEGANASGEPRYVEFTLASAPAPAPAAAQVPGAAVEGGITR